MDIDFFVQNVKLRCRMKGVSPSRACMESGAGRSLLDNVKRGQVPSVEKVQLLAQYLGVSTSELLGERPPEAPVFPEHPYLVLLYDKLSKEDQQDVMAFIEFKAAQAAKKKRSNEEG